MELRRWNASESSSAVHVFEEGGLHWVSVVARCEGSPGVESASDEILIIVEEP